MHAADGIDIWEWPVGEKQHAQVDPGGGTDPAGPETVARSYFASFATGDPDLIASHVSADFVNEHTAALGQGCEGRDVYRDRLPGFLADMVDLRYHVEALVVGGDDVMVTYGMSARWKGETPIDIRGAQHLVVRNGLVCRRVDYWDSAAFLVQADAAAAAALRKFGIGGP